jgi:hypothetical protein
MVHTLSAKITIKLNKTNEEKTMPYIVDIKNRQLMQANIREEQRVYTGEYKQMPTDFIDELREIVGHRIQSIRLQPLFAHQAQGNPNNVAFIMNEADLLRDKQTSMKVGKFLNKHVNKLLKASGYDLLTEPQIAKLANIWRSQVNDAPELHFAEQTRKAIATIYENGPSSCMAHDRDDYETEGVHPTEVYATEDIKLAYIKRDNRIVARALINLISNKYTRIYGDVDNMSNVLQAAGYFAGDLTGCRLLKLITNSGQPIMPYLDGNRAIYDHSSDYWVVGNVDSAQCYEFEAEQTNGLGEDSGERCHCCENHYDEYDMVYVEDSGELLCQDCLSDHYIYSEYDDRYVAHDDAVEVVGHGYMSQSNNYIVECNGSYYLEDEASEHDIVEIDGDYYHINDCVYSEYHEDWLVADDAIYCPENDDHVAVGYEVEINGINYINHSDEAIEAAAEELKERLADEIAIEAA